MKFRTKKKPVIGELRTRDAFAWNPILAKDHDGEWIGLWLERYRLTEEWARHGWQVVSGIALYKNRYFDGYDDYLYRWETKPQ